MVGFRRWLVVAGALGLSACTGQAQIPPVDAYMPSGLSKVPGRYAAQIQTGGWALTVKPAGFQCWMYDFSADMNAPYERAMRELLTQSVAHIDFVTTTLTPAQLQAYGYDAAITVYQGAADSAFTMSPNFFTMAATSEVSVGVTLAINDAQGLVYQHSLTSKGMGHDDVFSCGGASEAVGKAAQQAIQDVVQNTAVYLREGLRDRISRQQATTIPTAAGASVPRN
jgi:hypothetical protein